MTGRTFWSLATVTAILLAVVSVQATSHVRIVRLSYADGSVQMDRNISQGLERAMLNSPVVEGSRIVTGSDGLAEVEFENNSTVRLGEMSEVRFLQLLIDDAGDKVNEVELLRGTLYFDTHSGKGDIYRVIASGRTFVLRHNSQVRFMMSGDQVQAAVLNGEAQFADNTQLVRLKKNDTLTVDATNPSGFMIAKGVDRVPLDSWNSERAAYQTAYAYNNYGVGSRGLSAYGFQDLAYYGGFMSVPGYGLAWQPYGASSWMGWDPYMSGAWAFTPGYGYVWASAYPWGWMPFHYGSWAYTAGTGWFWYPGSSLSSGGVATNWQPTAPVVKGPAGYTAPIQPTTLTNGARPAIMVGVIGHTPAYIPGGPVPPNFRSVITDHSGITGVTAPSSGGSGSGSSAMAARNSRGANLNGANHSAARASTFAAPAARTATPSGHVFTMPPSPSLTTGGYGWSEGPALGSSGSSGVSAQGSGGMGRGTSAGGASHASSTGGSHASSGVPPK